MLLWRFGVQIWLQIHSIRAFIFLLSFPLPPEQLRVIPSNTLIYSLWTNGRLPDISDLPIMAAKSSPPRAAVAPVLIPLCRHHEQRPLASALKVHDPSTADALRDPSATPPLRSGEGRPQPSHTRTASCT
ncbi:hypothetical protein F5Y17DRAFT_253221 [Xylariaceae sp. FL0594]|nr:hypothetical protein F5Y17DRAFT_253221 [Xylariaceae sp. FL0594]